MAQNSRNLIAAAFFCLVCAPQVSLGQTRVAATPAMGNDPNFPAKQQACRSAIVERFSKYSHCALKEKNVRDEYALNVPGPCQAQLLLSEMAKKKYGFFVHQADQTGLNCRFVVEPIWDSKLSATKGYQVKMHLDKASFDVSASNGIPPIFNNHR